MLRRRIFLGLFLFSSIFFAKFALATDQSSTNYQSLGSSLTPLVKDISSTNYLMTAALDAIVGLSNSTNYKIEGGPANADVVAPVCGNGVIESGETCDNGASNGACPQACSSSCATNSCGGGGGGGGGGSPPPVVTGAEFSGRAYPQSDVILLKDGQIAVTTIAGPDGKFKLGVTDIQAGTYTFGIYAEDSKGTRSSIFAFPISVTSGTTATITGIFIAPTINVDKDVIKRGENVVIFGESAPGAEMTIQVNSDPIYVTTDSDSVDGGYIYTFNTGLVENGAHTTKSKASLSGTVSAFSLAVGFEVNNTGIAQPKSACKKADLNCDGRVNLVDFSIAAFWYKQSLSSSFIPVEIERLNGDGRVDLIDFSIMAYYWTG